MAETNESVILKIELDTGEAAQELSRITYQIATMKEEQKKLKKEIESGGDATGQSARKYAELDREIKRLTATEKALTGQIQKVTEAESEELGTSHQLGDSFRELDAQMRELENQYKSLSKAQRESAEGQAMRQQLIDLKQELKDFDAELGNHQRNVGNYPQTVQAIFTPMTKLTALTDGLKNTVSALGDVAKNGKTMLTDMAGGIKTATVQALKFIATPIGAILTGIVAAVKLLSAAFGKLKEAFAKNDTAGTQFAKLTASFQPILDVVTKMFDKLAQAIGWVAEKLANFIGGMSDAAKKAQELVVAQDDLEEAERQYTVNSAKRNKELSELRAKAADKEKYSAAERKKFMQEAMELQKKNLEDEKAIAAEKLRLLEENAKRTSDTSDETMNKIAQARAAMYQAEQKYFAGVKELQSQMTAFDKEERDARMKREQEETAKRKAELEKREKDVLEAAQKLAAMRDELVRRSRSALENEIADLEAKRDKELEIAGLSVDEQVEIMNYYAGEIKKLRDADTQLAAEAEKAKIEARQQARIDAGLDPQKTPEQVELEKLQEMRENDLLTFEEYEQAKSAIETKYAKERAETEKKLADEANERQQGQLKSMVSNVGNAAKGLAEVFGEYAEQSKEAAAAQKAFGLIGILTDQAQAISAGAKAIAEGIASAAPLPFPLNIPAIASITAQITGLTVGVMSSIMQAKQLFAQIPNAGNFAYGGVVDGNSYTGDKLIAYVNSGEGIYTGKQANTLLQEIANNPMRAGANMDAYAAATAAAVAALPAPVMVYSEYREFEQNVSTFNEIAAI